MRQKRIELISLILIIGLSIWTIYYLYEVVWGLFEVRFIKLDHTANVYGIDPALITTKIRNSLFFMWMPTAIIGLIGFAFAIFGALRVYQGRMFEPSTQWPVIAIGLATCLATLCGNIAYNLELDLIWPLTDRPPLARSWYWGMETVTIFFFGLGFVLLGFLQIESAKILQENREFV